MPAHVGTVQQRLRGMATGTQENTVAQFNITIAGATPLICNKFTDKAQLAASSGERASAVGERGTPREQAEERLYLTNDGEPMVPMANLFRCIIDAGTFFRVGRTKVTTSQSSMVPACLTITPDVLPIHSAEPWQVDTRPVRIPATGGRILCHRPLFHDWSLSFTAELDDSMMTAKLLREIVDAAGSRIGLGDFRPARKGPFGRFKVVQWDVVKDEPLLAQAAE